MNSLVVMGLNPGNQMLAPSHYLFTRGFSPLRHLPLSSVSVSPLTVQFYSERRIRLPFISASPPSRSFQFSVSAKMSDVDPEIAAEDMDVFVGVGNKVADVAGDILRKYFRQSFEISDKDDLSEFSAKNSYVERASRGDGQRNQWFSQVL